MQVLQVCAVANAAMAPGCELFTLTHAVCHCKPLESEHCMLQDVQVAHARLVIMVRPALPLREVAHDYTN